MVFLGRFAVFADLRLHKDQAGGVTAGTLNRQGTTAIAYANVCLWPGRDETALGTGGFSQGNRQLTAWRLGEADAPKPDDTWTVGGLTHQVLTVVSRFTAEEADGYAVYDCTVTRVL